MTKPTILGLKYYGKMARSVGNSKGLDVGVAMICKTAQQTTNEVTGNSFDILTSHSLSAFAGSPAPSESHRRLANHPSSSVFGMYLSTYKSSLARYLA
jgi:hypothetical protein